MVHGDVPARLRIPFEQREVDHPEKPVHAARHASEPLAEAESDLREDGGAERRGLREEHEEIAGPQRAGRGETLALRIGQELDRRRLPAVLGDPDPRETARAFLRREPDELVELAPRERGTAARRDQAADAVPGPERLGEDPEPG